MPLITLSPTPSSQLFRVKSWLCKSPKIHLLCSPFSHSSYCSHPGNLWASTLCKSSLLCWLNRPLNPVSGSGHIYPRFCHSQQLWDTALPHHTPTLRTRRTDAPLRKTREQETEGKASSRRRRSISLKGSTGRREVENHRRYSDDDTIRLRNPDPRSDQLTRAFTMSCWVLTSSYRPQEMNVIFQWSNKIRDHSSGPRKMDWRMGQLLDWEARTGRRWFQEPRAPSSRKAFSELIAMAHYGTFFFWPQNTLTYEIKSLSKCALPASTEKEAPFNHIFPLETTQYLPHTHLLSAEMREKNMFLL